MKEVFVDMITVSLAIAGGIARYMQELLEGGEFQWIRLIAHLVIGAVTGLSLAKVGAEMNLSENWQHIMSAWGGVVGLKAFDYITYIADKRLKTTR